MAAKCPKCGGARKATEKECGDCGVVFRDIRGGRGFKSYDEPVDGNCPWNDHGATCGVRGSLSESTNGQGPWFCSRHFWILKGYPGSPTAVSNDYRKNWYADRGLPFEAAKSGFNSIKKFGPKVAREPGEDEDFILGTQP